MRSTLWVAAGVVLAAASLNSTAAPSNAGPAPAASASTATATQDSRARLNERMARCKAMHGDEKTACQKDAHAQAESGSHKKSGAGRE